MTAFNNSIIIALTVLLWFIYLFGGWILYECYAPAHVYNVMFLEECFQNKYPYEFFAGIIYAFMVGTFMTFTILLITVQLQLLRQIQHDER